MKKLKKYLIAFVVCFPFVPTLVLAAGSPQNFQDLIGRAMELIQLLVPLLMAASVLFFVWGVAKYIYYGDSESEREKGRNFMIWGIIALFVMVSIPALVGLVKQTIFGSSGGGGSYGTGTVVGGGNSGQTQVFGPY